MFETPANRVLSNDAESGPPPRLLGDLLLETGLITETQLAEARAERDKTGAYLTKILVQAKCLTQEDLNACFVKRCKIPHISLLDYDIGSDVIALVPKEICLTHGLIPIDKLGRILTIAMVDPLDLKAVEAVAAVCPELRIKPILCNWAHFEQVTSKYFSANRSGGSGGGSEMSAASLGLSPIAKAAPKPLPPKPAAPADLPAASEEGTASVAANPVDTGALVHAIQTGFHDVATMLESRLSNTPAPAAAPVAEAPAFPMERFASTLQSSIREVLHEVLSTVQPPAAAPVPVEAAAPDWSGLEAAFRASVADLKSVVSAPAVASPASATSAPPAAAPPPQVVSSVPPEVVEALNKISESMGREPDQLTGEVMAEVIRDSIGGVMQESLATIMVQLRASTKPDQAAPDFNAFAETLRDSLGGMMQEMVSALLVQSRAQAPVDNSAQFEQIVTALQATQTGMVTALQELFAASQQSQDLQSTRLAAIAEAAVESSQQTSQLIEATLVQNERAHGLKQGARAAHASVSAFGALEVPTDDEAHAEADAEVRGALESENPLDTLTFDTFFPGETNAFTAKVCQSVAAKPGGDYNPLFVFGNVGIGKTHLISATGNHISQQNPGHRVGYVSASHFSRRLEEAIAAGAQSAFRDNYCHWDVLILDDIQFMGGRVEAQEEFFHIFNVLHQRGRQIIIASDNAPDRLGLLEQRLVSRFASGIVAELKAPEWATRMKIIKHYMDGAGVTLPEEICSLVAMRVSGDIRKMVGSIRKLTAYASHAKEPLSMEMATEILSHIAGEAA